MKDDFNYGRFIDWLDAEIDYYKELSEDEEEDEDHRLFAANNVKGIVKVIERIRKTGKI